MCIRDSACVAFDRSLMLYGPPDSRLRDAGRDAGLRFVAEGFVDRAYAADGALVSRTIPGSVIHDQDAVVARAIQMVKNHTVVAIDGSIVPIEIETLCIHG